jgi:flagellin-like protein
MKRLLKSKKALSPVVAAIILIAVTVAVSIAVAAWMGALTFTFMQTEEVKLTDLYFTTGNIRVTVKNTGTTPVTIQQGYVNTVDQSITSFTVNGNSQYLLNITYSWTAGNKYDVKLESSQGNTFLRTETAPTS